MKTNYVKPLAVALASVMISSISLNLTVTNLVQASERTAISTKVPEQSTTNTKKVLMAKLAHLDFFSAKFTQKVVSDSGETLEQSSGELAISKPNLANWHTIEPDELAIISDGKNVWFYNPWIDQVSVYSLSAAIAKTPILLLTSKDESLWQQYTVTRANMADENTMHHEDRFVISAIDINSQIKSLTLVFAAKEKGGQLKQFSFLDATGQLSHIKLKDFDAKKQPKANLFKFVLPEGVQVDDQRAN